MSDMNRRNGSMLRVVIFVLVGLSCIYFIYLDHDVRTRLHETEKTAQRYRRESETVSSQLNDLQATHNDFKERSNKQREDYTKKISECTAKHSILKNQHQDILGEYGKIKQQFDKLQEDQKQIESQRVSEYMKYKQEKEIEVSNLKDEVANVKREKDILSNNLEEAKKSLEEAKQSLQQLMNQQQQNQQHIQQGQNAQLGNQHPLQNQQLLVGNQGNLLQQNNAALNMADSFKNINQYLEHNKEASKEKVLEHQKVTSVNPGENPKLPDVNDNSKYQIQPAKDSPLDGFEQGAGQKPDDIMNHIDESFKKQHEEDQQQRKQVLPPNINGAEEKAKEHEGLKKEEETKQGESFGINVPAQHDEQNRQVVKPVLHEEDNKLPQPGPLKFDNAADDQQPLPFHRNAIRHQNIAQPGIEIQHQDDGVIRPPFAKQGHNGEHKDAADNSEHKAVLPGL